MEWLTPPPQTATINRGVKIFFTVWLWYFCYQSTSPIFFQTSVNWGQLLKLLVQLLLSTAAVCEFSTKKHLLGSDFPALCCDLTISCCCSVYAKDTCTFHFHSVHMKKGNDTIPLVNISAFNCARVLTEHVQHLCFYSYYTEHFQTSAAIVPLWPHLHAAAAALTRTFVHDALLTCVLMCMLLWLCWLTGHPAGHSVTVTSRQWKRQLGGLEGKSSVIITPSFISSI